MLTFVLGLLAGRMVPWDRLDAALVHGLAPLWSKLEAQVGMR